MRPIHAFSRRLRALQPLAPSRALLHPLWLGALAVLAVNDHVLKGSGLLPNAVTGKLSDFAGMLVAPLLLATLLRVRSQKAWLCAHVAVGAVFGAMQVSSDAAATWSAVMGLFGVPWTTTSDVSDLVALPLLALSFTFFPAAMRQLGTSNAAKAGRWAAAVGGLACSVATGAPDERLPEDPIDDFVNDIFSDAYIHNDNDTEIVVRIRPLKPSTDLDCGQVASDPGRLLTEPLFADVQSWTVRPGANVSVYDRSDTGPQPGGRPCWAALVDADNLAPIVLFWMDGQPAPQFISGDGFNDGDTAGVAIRYDDDGLGSWRADADFVFDVVPSEPRVPGFCAPPTDADRILWSDDTPVGDWAVISAEPGLDGCYDIELALVFGENDGFSDRSWYLCVPEGSFPFVAGDQIGITGGSGNTVIRSLVDPLSEQPGPSVEMTIRPGATSASSLWELTAGFVPEFDCGFVLEPECGTVVRQGSLVVSGDDFGSAVLYARDGATARLQGPDGVEIEVFITRAEERFAVDAECADGDASLGAELELVAVRRGGSEE